MEIDNTYSTPAGSETLSGVLSSEAESAGLPAVEAVAQGLAGLDQVLPIVEPEVHIESKRLLEVEVTTLQRTICDMIPRSSISEGAYITYRQIENTLKRSKPLVWRYIDGLKKKGVPIQAVSLDNEDRIRRPSLNLYINDSAVDLVLKPKSKKNGKKILYKAEPLPRKTTVIVPRQPVQQSFTLADPRRPLYQTRQRALTHAEASELPLLHEFDKPGVDPLNLVVHSKPLTMAEQLAKMRAAREASKKSSE